MISNAALPPYNRFDRVPRHALQCGLPQSEQHDHQQHHHHHYKHHYDKHNINDILHGHQGSAMILYPNNNNNASADSNLRSKLNSTGSRNSVASTISSISQGSMRNGTQSSNSSSEKILASQSSLDSLLSPTSGDNIELLNRLQQELYVEKSPPPPYNGKHRILPDAPPNRTELPKKSHAAQQRIAEMLKESEKPTETDTQNAFGKFLVSSLNLNEFFRNDVFIDGVDLTYHQTRFRGCKNTTGFFPDNFDKVKNLQKNPSNAAKLAIIINAAGCKQYTSSLALSKKGFLSYLKSTSALTIIICANNLKAHFKQCCQHDLRVPLKFPWLNIPAIHLFNLITLLWASQNHHNSACNIRRLIQLSPPNTFSDSLPAYHLLRSMIIIIMYQIV